MTEINFGRINVDGDVPIKLRNLQKRLNLNTGQFIEYCANLLTQCFIEIDHGYKICAVDNDGDPIRELVLVKNESDAVAGIGS